MIDTPSIIKVISKTVVLTRVFPVFSFRVVENVYMLFIINRESEI